MLVPLHKMHATEVNTDISLVARLLKAQFAHWADLPIEPVDSSGTDNAIYRLGDDMVVRLPRIQRATQQMDKQHAWLPRLTALPPTPSQCGHPPLPDYRVRNQGIEVIV